jgi:hypothetical protein
VYENEHSQPGQTLSGKTRLVSGFGYKRTRGIEEGQSRACGLRRGKQLRSAQMPKRRRMQPERLETNQKVHNEHRAPRAMPQGTESAQMRTQKLRLTFSTDIHIHIDLATPRTSVPMISISRHNIHTSFILKVDRPAMWFIDQQHNRCENAFLLASS